MTPPQPGDRRPREGRCPDCDRPLTDEVYETRVLGGFLGIPEHPVTDWWQVDHHEGHCAGEPLCDGERVDWEQRARDAEARALAAEGRVKLVDATLVDLMGVYADLRQERDAAFRDGVRHGMLAARRSLGMALRAGDADLPRGAAVGGPVDRPRDGAHGSGGF
jgi:hypothetical protein